MYSLSIIVFAGIAAVTDIRTKRISNKLILLMFASWLALIAFDFLSNSAAATLKVADSALGALVGGGIFLAVYFISKKGLGGGDVKFMAAAGLYLGLAGTMPAILYGSILAALVGFGLVALKKISRKDTLPLAPFLLAGIVITVLLP
ncbi:MAG: A24 family peptidase [Oscillospiraceae bacterium]|nr:A24 family peptidase [Oscillospiraceae bacterium]